MPSVGNTVKHTVTIVAGDNICFFAMGEPRHVAQLCRLLDKMLTTKATLPTTFLLSEICHVTQGKVVTVCITCCAECPRHMALPLVDGI